MKIGTHAVISNSVKIEEGVTIEDYARIIGSPRITLGRNVYINCFTMMLGEIEVEDDVLISQHVVIWGRSHIFYDRNKPIWVQHEQKWEQEVEFISANVGENQKVEFLLFKGGEDEPYRSLHLRLNVREKE